MDICNNYLSHVEQSDALRGLKATTGGAHDPAIRSTTLEVFGQRLNRVLRDMAEIRARLENAKTRLVGPSVEACGDSDANGPAGLPGVFGAIEHAIGRIEQEKHGIAALLDEFEKLV